MSSMMSSITSSIAYDVSVPAGTPPAAAPAARQRGLWVRFYDALIAARQRKAMEVIRRHSFLLPNELEQATWKLNERSEDSLPFIR